MTVDGVEDHSGKAIGFEQMPEFQQRRGIGRRRAIEASADKSADRLAVLDRIFDALVRQAETLLGHVHAPRRVSFFLLAYSRSEKLFCMIARTVLCDARLSQTSRDDRTVCNE